MTQKDTYTFTYRSALKKALRDAVRYQPKTAVEGSAWLSRAIKVVQAPFAARKGVEESIARYSHDVTEKQRANLHARTEQPAPTQPPVKNTRRRDIPGKEIEKLLMSGKGYRDL